jgi:hypothetical protein
MSDTDKGQPTRGSETIERQGLIRFFAFCAVLGGLMLYFGFR